MPKLTSIDEAKQAVGPDGNYFERLTWQQSKAELGRQIRDLWSLIQLKFKSQVNFFRERIEKKDPKTQLSIKESLQGSTKPASLGADQYQLLEQQLTELRQEVQRNHERESMDKFREDLNHKFNIDPAIKKPLRILSSAKDKLAFKRGAFSSQYKDCFTTFMKDGKEHYVIIRKK